MQIFIVIPTYNEAENLEKLLDKIFQLHPDFNIIIVDDNSPDSTGEIAEAMSRKDPRLHVIRRPEKAGLGTAYVRGFQEALLKGADLIFEMDADFSHDPKYLINFLKASEDSDLVIGSRYVNGVRVEGWKFRRLLLSKLANNLDEIKSDGYAFQIEMTSLAFKHGFRVFEIPIIFKEREHGFSKISRNVVWEAFWLTLRCRASVFEIFKHLSFLFRDYNEFVEKESNRQTIK